MFTFAPSPSWRDVLAALSARVEGGEGALAAPWRRPGDEVLWFSRASLAMASVALAWSRAAGRPARIWVPSYFCSEPVVNLQHGGAAVEFYPVTETLAPDWAACRSLDVPPPDIFVLVHYFATPSDSASARQFADAAGALLLEDAAHVLRSEPGIGEQGDIVVYAPHKWLALPHGSIVAVRPSSRMTAGDIRASLGAYPAAQWLPWLAKRMTQKLPVVGAAASRWRSTSPPEFLQDPLPPAPADVASISPFASRLIDMAGLDRVAALRGANYAALDGVAGHLNGGRAPLAAGAPYRYVLRCPGPEVAGAVYTALRDRRLPVESWPDLPAEVRAAPQRHAMALALRRSTVLLPVHQTLRTDRLAAAYGAALQAL